jgi:hypothetical protein
LTRSRRIAFNVHELPAPGQVGIAVAEIEIPRGGDRPSLRVVTEARSDVPSRAVTIRAGSSPGWRAGIVWAAFRWSAGEGKPDLWLSWRHMPPDGEAGLGYAEVSDVLLLAGDQTAQWAVRALYDVLPTLGRPPGLTDFRDEDRLAETTRAMVRDRVRITRATLAAQLGITESALRGYLKSTGRSVEQIVIRYSPR